MNLGPVRGDRERDAKLRFQRSQLPDRDSAEKTRWDKWFRSDRFDENASMALGVVVADAAKYQVGNDSKNVQKGSREMIL